MKKQVKTEIGFTNSTSMSWVGDDYSRSIDLRDYLSFDFSDGSFITVNLKNVTYIQKTMVK